MDKHKIKSVIFILDGYPYGGSTTCVFARNLIVAMADMGIGCTVITPQIIAPGKIKKRSIPYFHLDHSSSGNDIPVYAPQYIYYPANLKLTKLSMQNHLKAVLRTIKKEKIKADAIYGHFIFQCGLTAAKVGKKLGIPSFLGAGESDKLIPGNRRNHGVYELGVTKLGWQNTLNMLSGIICVSDYTKQLLFENGFLDNLCESKTAVFPNGVNQEIFRPGNKSEARRELGLPENDFIALFVGAFNDNKGVLRVSEAIKQISNAKVVFLGKGALRPDCQGILFCGSCDNGRVARYMQAADCFVLPTKSEGCCNSILEALSCGAPVVSSDLPFNNGILDDSNSIRINPNSIHEIKEALEKLNNNIESREKMAKAAELSATDFSIESRAGKIIRFMSEVTE